MENWLHREDIEMYKICIFAGTTEGREIVDFLTSGSDALITACVATEYGEELLEHRDNLLIHSGRMTEEEMEGMLEEDFDLVIDATHPYAKEVTENIRLACERNGKEYFRVLRESISGGEGALYFSDAEEAASFLDRRDGNILITTGSKEILKYKDIRGFSDRVWARVLPMESSLIACREAGLSPAHIIAMQGPFSEEMNRAMIRAVGARYLLTKDGGDAGGFREKIEAANKEGVTLLVIGRPFEEEGRTVREMKKYLEERFSLSSDRHIIVAGIGPGSKGEMTVEVKEAIEAADLLIGAKRMLEVSPSGKAAYEAVRSTDIAEYIKAHKEYRNVVVLMSGDSGFFSGTKKLLPLLKDFNVKVLPGLSSISVLASRLGMSYEDITTISLHGRPGGIGNAVSKKEKLFVLTGGENTPKKICEDIASAGFGEVKVYIGERLGYPNERIITGTACELAMGEYDELSAMIIENSNANRNFTAGLPDDSFKRLEDVPMTKSEVRAVCLSKLRLDSDSLCWDVGAGTGSVSIEMALCATKGRVYAIEKKEEACALAEENGARFGVDNLEIVTGKAPEACENLPAPSHVFIGGSSGNIRDIIGTVLEKNPAARIVATAITLESISELNNCMEEFGFDETEVVSITVARDRKAGSYHIMTGQNPIYIFTMQKR